MLKAFFIELYCAVLRIVWFLRNLVYFLIFLVTKLPRIALSGWKEGAEGLTTDRIHRALDVDIFDVPPSYPENLTLMEEFAALLAEGRGAEALARIEAADHARTLTPQRYFVAEVGFRGLLLAFHKAMLMQRSDLILIEKGRIEALAAAHPGNHIAAAAVARLNIDIGMSFRGDAFVGDIPAENWRIFLKHMAVARAAIADLDPVARDSPLLASVRFALIPAEEDAARVLRRWYHDRAGMVPKLWDAHGEFANFLLPQWFGSDFEALDRAARDACQRYRDVTGDAPYAFYMAEAETCFGAPVAELMDVDLFLKGIEDYSRVSATQETFNHAAAMILAIAPNYLDQTPIYRAARERLMAGLRTHFAAHVRELHVSAFGDMDQLMGAVAEAFRPELLAGARIGVGLAGLEARMPPEAAPEAVAEPT